MITPHLCYFLDMGWIEQDLHNAVGCCIRVGSSQVRNIWGIRAGETRIGGEFMVIEILDEGINFLSNLAGVKA